MCVCVCVMCSSILSSSISRPFFFRYKINGTFGQSRRKIRNDEFSHCLFSSSLSEKSFVAVKWFEFKVNELEGREKGKRTDVKLKDRDESQTISLLSLLNLFAIFSNKLAIVSEVFVCVCLCVCLTFKTHQQLVW